MAMQDGVGQSGSWLEWFQTQSSKVVDYFLDDNDQEQRYVPKGDNAVETQTLAQRLNKLFGDNQTVVLVGIALVAGFLLFKRK